MLPTPRGTCMLRKRTPEWMASHYGLLELNEHHKVLRFITIVSLLVFVPFSIKNVVLGEYIYAGLLIAFQLSLLLEVYWFYTRRRPLITYLLPVVLLIACAVFAIPVLGIIGSYWAFPIAVCVVFVVPTRVSSICNGIMIVGIAVVGYYYLEHATLLRLVGALSITAICAQFMMSSLIKTQDKLKELSITDAMTGALNRSQLEAYLGTSLELHRKTGMSSSIALIDIDNFKQVNDSFGHDVGDQMIQSVVKVIKEHLRSSDFIFRLGGDEFLILFRKSGLKDSYILMEKLKQKISELHHHNELEASISVGMAPSCVDIKVNEWLKHADLSLYDAKKQGRNRIVIHRDH
ncbi:putative GGDEF family protein [Vibrio nigripulchritudo MADA3029]|nr:putative GGDEF family protein [Vibrio nigripulchritudo AM115]CCN43952.1 putative GGDEF family protein [Vibrio nigripulchritudo FTn2]CCN49281.1 putative GGDEF family protein [Vibrio nigripulchritudo MADA3020]CCN54266.1 putative GGDEF family protein [Vibrio nigripulchritudo MADA3021]CCN61336.1 putative GGDEF family protein [Vibrio nigripulchritudo MADA3029]CCN62807.1 putative GGDEF family protein [Vibrio nigripulchritudo POn4]CCN71964.1 putative GGDEF family protein [Vibrio nigripulchritudo 